MQETISNKLFTMSITAIGLIAFTFYCCKRAQKLRLAREENISKQERELSDRFSRKNYGFFSDKVSSSWQIYMRTVTESNSIDLSHGDPLFGPHPLIREALQEIASQIICKDTHVRSLNFVTLHKYRWKQQPNDAMLDTALTEFRRVAIPVTDEINPLTREKKIVVGHGTTQLFYVALLCIMKKGGTLLLPVPTYSLISWVCEIIEQPSNIFLLQPDPISEKITPNVLRKTLTENPGIDCLFLINPNNPTGNIYTKEEYTELAKVLCDYPKVWVIEDSVYDKIFLTSEAKQKFTQFASIVVNGISMHDRTITIKGVSKSNGLPRLRMGYATCGDNKLMYRMRHYLYAQTYAPSEIDQMLAAKVITDTPESYYEENAQIYRKNRDFVISAIENLNDEINTLCGTTDFCYIKAAKPDAGFFLMLDFNGLKDMLTDDAGTAINDSLTLYSFFVKKAKVHLISGVSHGYSNDQLKLRLTFSATQEILEEGIQRISNAIKTTLSNVGAIKRRLTLSN